MVELRWAVQKDNCHYAYSGKLFVGMVVTQLDGTIHWRIDAVSTKHICKGYGDSKSIALARRSVSRSWSKWCQKAGLRQ